MNEKIEAGKTALVDTTYAALVRISGRVGAPGKLPLFSLNLLHTIRKDLREAVSAIVEGIIEECKADEGKPPAGA